MNLFNASQLQFVFLKDKGNSLFTVRSKTTNKDYTFKINTTLFNGIVYSHIYVETRYLEFKYLGFYSKGNIYKKRKINTNDSAIAIAWLLRNTTKGKFDFLNNNVELFHLGKCLCCNRTLTDATSIELGVGPYCRTKKIKNSMQFKIETEFDYREAVTERLDCWLETFNHKNGLTREPTQEDLDMFDVTVMFMYTDRAMTLYKRACKRFDDLGYKLFPNAEYEFHSKSSTIIEP